MSISLKLTSDDVDYVDIFKTMSQDVDYVDIFKTYVTGR